MAPPEFLNRRGIGPIGGVGRAAMAARPFVCRNAFAVQVARKKAAAGEGVK